MNNWDPRASSPADGGPRDASPALHRCDPIGSGLPLGRPVQVTAIDPSPASDDVVSPAPSGEAATAAALVWPPLDEDLDAVEVIDLDAIRSKALPLLRSRVSRGASVATFSRPAPASAPSFTHDGDGRRPLPAGAEGLAWPPPAEEVDAIAMIDMHAAAATRGAVALAPFTRSLPAPVTRPAGEVPAAPAPTHWGRLIVIGTVFVCAAGGGYLVTQRQWRGGGPGLAVAVTPDPDSASPHAAPLAAPESAPDAGASPGVPSDTSTALRDEVDPLAESRRLLALGDRENVPGPATATVAAPAPGPAIARADSGVSLQPAPVAEAPAIAAAATPAGVPGRSTEVPPGATRDVATRTEPMLTPPPVAEARPVAVPRLDDAGVRRSLEAYRSAFDRLDAAAASAIVPSIDSKALARAFNSLASQRLDFDRCEVEVQDATARATCEGRAASVPKVGSSKPRVDPRTWAFVLERQGDRWQITSAHVTQR